MMLDADVPTYVHRPSNHPHAVINQLLASAEKRLCSITHSKTVFDEAAHLYQDDLMKSGYEYDKLNQSSQLQTTSMSEDGHRRNA